MSKKYAAFNAQGAIVAFYDSNDSPVPSSATVIEITDAEWQSCLSTSGYAVVDGALVAPTPLTAAQIEAQQTAQALAASVQSALAAGLTVTSTSTPAVNGAYPVDATAQTKITSIELFIVKNGTFPGMSGTSLAWHDVLGAPHIFPSIAIFSEFATAVANYVTDLDLYGAGASGATLPAASVTIS